MDKLKMVAEELRQILDEKRTEMGLDFREWGHIYTIIDQTGQKRTDFPSVSKLLKKFYPEFDKEGNALRIAEGNQEEAERLMREWEQAGIAASGLGSRTHFILEKECLSIFGHDKQVRQPKFNCDENQTKRSDTMVEAGRKYIQLMISRGAVLLDTEVVLGSSRLGFVGQADKFWVMQNGDNIGIVCTDWKTNKPEKFEIQIYHKPMFAPFDDLLNNDLNHYNLQLSLYGKLLLDMLQGSKYQELKFFGSVVVNLKDDGTFQEYKVPKTIKEKIMEIDIIKHIS